MRRVTELAKFTKCAVTNIYPYIYACVYGSVKMIIGRAHRNGMHINKYVG